MGAKHSASQQTSCASLNPSERRRLSQFLEARGSKSQFSKQDILDMWKELLVPDLLNLYSEFLMNQSTKNNQIGVEEFAFIYTALVRGEPEDKVSALAGILGPPKKNSFGMQVISYSSLVKYLGDLLQSYYRGLKQKDDPNYKSWTNFKQPDWNVIELIMDGLCSELGKHGDDIPLNELESWMRNAGMVSMLHSYVLGSLYNLEPEVKATIIPLAIMPTTKTHTFLDLSHVVYLNSNLPFEEKAQWRFLFSTQTHGESFSKLMGCLTNTGSTLLVIESEDSNVFGGFISTSISPGPRWVGSEDCFLFKLRPTVEIYRATGYNDHYVYLNLNQASLPNGLGMGGQHNYWGLWVDSHFGLGECNESCTTFKNYKMLATNKKFKITKLELWGVGKRPLTAAERGERSDGHESVLDKDLAATAMLEMAGRKTYSQGLRGTPPKE